MCFTKHLATLFIEKRLIIDFKSHQLDNIVVSLFARDLKLDICVASENSKYLQRVGQPLVTFRRHVISAFLVLFQEMSKSE